LELIAIVGIGIDNHSYVEALGLEFGIGKKIGEKMKKEQN